MTTLDEIEARIADCKTYNFGMRAADQLAHGDVPRLVAALRAVEAVKPFRGCYSGFEGGYNGAISDVQTAIREALGS